MAHFTPRQRRAEKLLKPFIKYREDHLNRARRYAARVRRILRAAGAAPEDPLEPSSNSDSVDWVGLLGPKWRNTELALSETSEGTHRSDDMPTLLTEDSDSEPDDESSERVRLSFKRFRH